jgi:hypothetical protein
MNNNLIYLTEACNITTKVKEPQNPQYLRVVIPSIVSHHSNEKNQIHNPIKKKPLPKGKQQEQAKKYKQINPVRGT